MGKLNNLLSGKISFLTSLDFHFLVVGQGMKQVLDVGQGQKQVLVVPFQAEWNRWFNIHSYQRYNIYSERAS